MTFGITAGTAITTGVSAAASIGGGIAAGQGQKSAAGASAKSAKAQMDWLKSMYGDASNRLAPYFNLGKYGAEQYQKALPELTRPYSMADYQKDPLYTPMVRNLAELQATPGYQFQLQQGQQGLEQSAAAKGGLLSGAQGKAMQDYGQNQAATGFQNAWQRAQTAYNSAFTNNMNQKNQIGNMYINAANQGQTAIGTLGNIGNSVATNSNVPYQDLNNAQSYQAMAPYNTGANIAKSIPGLIDAGQSIYNAYNNRNTTNTGANVGGNINWNG